MIGLPENANTYHLLTLTRVKDSKPRYCGINFFKGHVGKLMLTFHYLKTVT